MQNQEQKLKKDVLKSLTKIRTAAEKLSEEHFFSAWNAGIYCCDESELNPALWPQCHEYIECEQGPFFAEIQNELEDIFIKIKDKKSFDNLYQDLLYLEDETETLKCAAYFDDYFENDMGAILEWMRNLTTYYNSELERFFEVVNETYTDYKDFLEEN